MPETPEQFATPDPAALEHEASTLGLAAPADEGPPPGDRAWSVLAARSDELMRQDGVVMVGLGHSEIGDPALLVGVRRADQLAGLPSELDGLPVRGQVIGEVDALAGKTRRDRR